MSLVRAWEETSQDEFQRRLPLVFIAEEIGGAGDEFEGAVQRSVVRCKRLEMPKIVLQSASGSLKSDVGGPKRREGLPYRSPWGLIVASWTAEALLTLSDGEGPRLTAAD